MFVFPMGWYLSTTILGDIVISAEKQTNNQENKDMIWKGNVYLVAIVCFI